MHALDHELDEYEAGIDALESSDEFEWLGEAEPKWAGEAVFDEVEEMELAAELLGIQSEEELEEFLGKLIKKAGGAVRKFAGSNVGKALGGVLKTVASKALPIAGTALGNMVLPGIGGMIGGKLASAGGKLFGLELEGMSAQDQEFEVARRFVRLGGEAARQAARRPVRGSPANAAKDAVLAAAQIHAPGLMGRSAPRGPRGGGRSARRGRVQGYGGGYPVAYGGNGGYPGAYGGDGGYAPVYGNGAGYGGLDDGVRVGRGGAWVRRGNFLVVRLEG
ncbi:MAG TPA: hypothetical protein VGB92_02675 [Longimicrobium sp.]|jgi:hypothetical protein